MSVALAYAAYRSPQRWSAAGLACVTTSAVVATPELVDHLLRAAVETRERRPIRWVSRLLAIAGKIVYGCLGLIALAAIGATAVGAVSPSGLLVALAIVVAVFGASEFVRRSLREMAEAVATGGDVDRRLRERHDEWRWPVAGLLFFVGTLLQLVGTFVE